MALGYARKALVFAAVLFIVAAAGALRFAYINADPPRGLSVSRAPYTDEGLKYYQARNRAVFGRWFVETPYAVQGHLDSSPVPTVAGAAIFSLFGAGRVQARCLSVACGTLSVLVMVLIGLRRGRGGTAILAGALMAVNSLLFSYDRLALFEAPTIFLCLCAALAFLEGGRRRLILVPLLLVLAYFTRVTAVAVAAALALTWALEKRRSLEMPVRRQLLIAAGVVAAVVLALVALAVFMPENQITGQLRERFESESYREFPAALVVMDLGLRTFPDSVAALWMPLFLVTALLGAVVVVRRGLGDGRAGPGFLFLMWFLAAFVMIAPLDYRPTRYYLLMLPAACFLAAEWLTAAAAAPQWRPSRAHAGYIVVGIFAAAGIAAVGLRFLLEQRHDLLMFFDLDAPALRRLGFFIEGWFIGGRAAVAAAAGNAAVFKAAMLRRVLIMPLVGAGLFGAGSGLAALWRSYAPAGLRARAGLLLATGVVLVILSGQILRIADYWKPGNLRYEVLGAKDRTVNAIGERSDACIGGNWATTACMGTPYFTFPLARGNGNAWDTFKRFPVTHLLLERSAAEIGYMWETYPDEMRHCTLLDEFEIDNYKLVLLEYHPPEDAERPAGPFEERREP